MAYVPPALRKKFAAEPDVKPSSSSLGKRQSHKLFSSSDIRHHYWPPSATEAVPWGLTLSTLNNSAQFPFELTHVVLRRGQNPCWKTFRIVSAKTNLNLLPEYFEQKDKRAREEEQTKDSKAGHQSWFSTTTQHSTSSSVTASTTPTHEQVSEDAAELSSLKSIEESEHVGSGQKRQRHEISTVPPIQYEPYNDPPYRPIAVFEEVGGNEFKFVGWYTISGVSILAPWSQELAEMLEQKETLLNRLGKPTKTIERNPKIKGLRREWAVARFEKLTDPEPPAIKHVVPLENMLEHQRQHKSVNELLAELRLQDKEGAEAEPGFEVGSVATKATSA